MPVDYDFIRGVDIPEWLWMNFSPVNSFHGTANAYDGERYIYWIIQQNNTTGNSTTALWQYDTWSDGWGYLSGVTSGNHGMDLEYDEISNVLIYTLGGSQTIIQVYNLNTTAVTFANVSIPARGTANLTTLPVAAAYGSSIGLPNSTFVLGDATAANASNAVDSGTAAAGTTTTSIVATEETGTFGAGMVNLYVRFTSGTQAGVRRLITAVTNRNTLTTAAFPAAPAAGDTFIVEVPEGTATGGTTTSVTMTGAGWATNVYASSDVVIVAGTGAGQRRRLASNTADTLTLAAAYAAPATNPRVGPFATAPDATSVFRIVPSDDFIYYQPGNNNAGLHRLDVRQTGAAPTWTAMTAAPGGISGGGNTFYPGTYAPFNIIAFRGNGTRDIYQYNIGTNNWVVLSNHGTSDTFTTGASAGMMPGRRRMFIVKENTQRTYIYDFTTGLYEPGPYLGYATTQGFDGKRIKFIRTPNGIEFIYLMRAGGMEFWRITYDWSIK